jgi:hypothetical protein
MLLVGRGRCVGAAVTATVGVGVGDGLGEGVGDGVAGAIVAVGEGLGRATGFSWLERAIAVPSTTTSPIARPPASFVREVTSLG